MDIVEKFPEARSALTSLLEELAVPDSAAHPSETSAVEGGLSGDLRRLIFSNGDGKEVLRLVIKSTQDSEMRVNLSKNLGLAREAIFFSQLGDKVGQLVHLPKVMYSEGDMTTGKKIILMEDLQQVTQSGYLFGAGSPLNHNKDLRQLAEAAGNPVLLDVVKVTVRATAKLHARFWKDEATLGHSWLRGSSWYQGGGRQEWEAAQQQAASFWKQFKKRALENGETAVEWPADIVAVVNASISKIDWQSFAECQRPWTLVHGDFHPGNMMWLHSAAPHTTESAPPSVSSEDECGGKIGPTAAGSNSDDRRVVFLDWEMVGLGSGPQDIGQYMISHMDPTMRRECEQDVVRAYYDTLVAERKCLRGDGPDHFQYSWSDCWQEYVAGGAGRWMWFLAYFAAHGTPDFQEFFIKQVGSFVRDHGLTPETIGQPRC